MHFFVFIHNKKCHHNTACIENPCLSLISYQVIHIEKGTFRLPIITYIELGYIFPYNTTCLIHPLFTYDYI